MEEQRQDEAEGSDCLEWYHVPLHSAWSSPLRRPMGNRRQSSEKLAIENTGRRETYSRRVDDAVSARPELAADRRNRGGPLPTSDRVLTCTLEMMLQSSVPNAILLLHHRN